MREDWDDPENPVVRVIESGTFKGLNVRKRDVEFGEKLDMDPEKLAIARQPLFGGLNVMDWSDDDE